MPSDSSAERIEFVALAGALPFVAQGLLTSLEDGVAIARLDRVGNALAAGTRVIINFPNSERARLVAHIRAVDGNIVTCSTSQERERERREFPRLIAGVPLRYRVVAWPADAGEANRWLAGSDEPLSRGDWQSPDDLMNFSVTGLRFHTHTPCAEGSMLLVEFGLKGHSQRWRGTARVIRVTPVPEEEANDLLPSGPSLPTHRIAVAFEQIPSEAEAALSEMTLQIQEALI